MFIDQCLSQPSSEKLPLATERNKYRGLQPGNMEKVRDLGILSPKWNVSTKSLLSEVKKTWCRGGIKFVQARGDGEQGPQHDHHTYKLTETEHHVQSLHGSASQE